MRNRKLEEILEKIEIITVGIVAITVVSMYPGLKIYENYIQKNLESYAINCNAQNNLIGCLPDWKKNLPKIKNKDLDKNGKYESIIIYVQDGKKVYQEIRKTDEGLMLTEPKPYE